MKQETLDTLISKSHTSPLFVVFLRHTGCTFCREWVRAISKQQEKIKGQGYSLVFVHMSSPKDGESFLKEFGLKEFTAISDPKLQLYKALGAKRAKLTDLLKLSVWKNVFKKGLLEGYGAGLPAGDGFQLGGFAILSGGKIQKVRWAESIDTPPIFTDLLDQKELKPTQSPDLKQPVASL
jgi:hypothetical protein